MSSQSNWRFCTKCYSLFWYGYPTTGSCPAGGGHSPLESDSPTHAASSLNFELDIVDGNPAPGPNPGGGGGSSSAGTQGNWRFCTKCYSLFWYGYGTAGTCAAGGGHSPLESASPTHAATSIDFQLQIAGGAVSPPPPSSPPPSSPPPSSPPPSSPDDDDDDDGWDDDDGDDDDDG
jgi:hypothetical protein